MKPFNLEEALAGKPFITRSGFKVSKLFVNEGNSSFPYYYRNEGGTIITVTNEGKYYHSINISQNDLFMDEEQTKTETMIPQFLNLGQLKQLHRQFGCSEFRTAIEEIIKPFLLESDTYNIVIEDKYIKQLISAGTSPQRDAVLALGIILQQDKNAITGKFDEAALHKLNMSLFDKLNVIQVCNGASDYINRRDLMKKAFFVPCDYEVVIHNMNPPHSGTVIEIRKK